MPADRQPLGYLVSQYPTVTHGYILGEIQTLRKLGFDIRVVSIRKPDRSPDHLGASEQEEYRRAFFVLNGMAGIVRAHLRTLLRHPVAYAATLWYAIRLGRSDLRRAASYAVYFAEAVVAGDYLLRAGVRHFHTHYASTPALLVSRLFRIDFSMTIHGSGEFNDMVGFHMAEKVKHAAFVATISRFGCSQTMRGSAPRDWNKIHSIPLGVDLQNFSARPRRGPVQVFNILCVGSLVPAKGYPMLFAAVARLLKRGRNVTLTIVGEGPQRRSLERAVADLRLAESINLAGACNHDRVVDFYREADAFALASFAEGVPVVLMEAMAMEIPCVATWIAGIPELIRDGVDGLLVPPADPEALANAIERLMDDTALRIRLGQSARRRVLDGYNVSRNAALLGELFRQYSEPLEQSREASVHAT